MTTTATPLNCNRRGQELSCYYNVGDDTTQVWAEHLGIIGDANLAEGEELNEQSSRRSTRDVREYNEGEIDISYSGTQMTDTDYEGYQLFRGMRRGGNPQDVMVLTGAIGEVGSEGWRGMMRNSDRGVNGPETGGMTTNFNLQPSACTDTPVRFVRINTADVVSDFDPTTFSTVST